MKFIIPTSQSYRVAVGSIDSVIKDAKLYYGTNAFIKSYDVKNKTASIDDIGFRAGVHHLKVKLKEANKKFKFVLYKDNKHIEIEPNDFLGFAETYKSSMIGNLDTNDIDNFMIKVKTDGDLTIDLNNTIDSEDKAKVYFRLLGADESSIGKKKILYLKDANYTFSDIEAGLYMLRIEPSKLKQKISYKLNIDGDLDYTYKSNFAGINENRYYDDIMNRGSKLQSSDISHIGNLIILTGDSDNPTDPLYLASQKLSKTVYKRFSLRGLDDEDIFWINNNSQVDLDYDGIVDTVVDDTNLSLSHFEDSFKWAETQVNDGPLYLYMVDHGANGAFKISNTDFDGDGSKEILYASQLKKYIDSFIDATDRDVIVIIEACKSGSSEPVLKEGSNSDKIAVITSSEASKVSYIDMFGNISFTKFFVDELLRGNSIKLSFDNAKNKLSSQGGVYKKQTPILSEMSTTLAETKIGGDFAIADMSLTTIDTISVNDNEDFNSIDLTKDENDISISANITAGSGIKKVWATLLPPSISVTTEDFATPNLSNYVVDLTYNKYKKAYIGDYSFAKDSINGEYNLLLNVEDLDGFVYTKTLDFNVISSSIEVVDEINTTINTNEYNTTTKPVNIGWSMIRLPAGNIENITALKNAQIIWGYESAKWSAYSSKEIIKTKNNNFRIILSPL